MQNVSKNLTKNRWICCENFKFFLALLISLALSISSYFYWVNYFILFHNVLEILCILAGFSIFIITWQILDKSHNGCQIICYGFLIITVFDLLHAYYFQTHLYDFNYSREMTNKFWILARLVEALMLLLITIKIPKVPVRRFKHLILASIIPMVTTIFVFLYPYEFRLWNEAGITQLKIGLEYFIIIIYLFTLFFMNKKNQYLPMNYKLIKLAIIAAIASEICFTLYKNDPASFFYLFGHILKILCYTYLFIGIYSEVVYSPYKIIESKLDLSENLFTSVFQNAPNGIAVVSISGQFIRVNNKFKTLFNKENNSYVELLYDNHKEVYEEHVKKLIEEEPIIKFKKSYKNKVGGLLWLLITESMVKNQEGTPLYFISQVEDITEQVIKDNYIIEQKEQLQAILDNMSDSLLILDDKGKVIHVNNAVKKNIIDFQNYEKIGDILKDYEIYDAKGKIFKDDPVLKRILMGENVQGHQYTIKNNGRVTSYEIICTPIFNKEGILKTKVIIGRDSTQRLKNEEALLIKTQYEILKRMIDNLELGYGRFTFPDYKIVDMNPMFYETLKEENPEIGSIQEVIGRTLGSTGFFEKKEETVTKIKDMIQCNNSAYYTYKSITLEGKKRYFKLLNHPIFGLNNKVVEVVTVSIDITDEIQSKKKMEENLKIQEEIFANISHELKTPLNVIFSTNQLMEFYMKNGFINDDYKIAKAINIVKQNCYRFTKIINNVVDLSKMESGFFKLNLTNVNIVEVVEDIVQSVSEYVSQRNLNIIFDTDVEEEIIACDPDKIERILLNLISNAIKFTNPGGSIFVEVFVKDQSVEIWVRDTGIGMDSVSLNNIFKRFHQVDKSLSRNFEGSGIGLSLVQSIVELHKGKIWVESKPGYGSVFKIELPKKMVEVSQGGKELKTMNSKVEMINIEFADIYSV